ncbi:hypothetical protein AOA60_26935 [Pseudomonas sp. 2822-17]|nr:hypothetical protein AOA60_26935 [Pseudomonas sp. 2822-17]
MNIVIFYCFKGVVLIFPLWLLHRIIKLIKKIEIVYFIIKGFKNISMRLIKVHSILYKSITCVGKKPNHLTIQTNWTIKQLFKPFFNY